jgi:Protein of unknown function (DUF2958)
MKFFTEAQRDQLLANGRAARDAMNLGMELDPRPVISPFTRGGYARWLLTEIHPLLPDLAYGLCDLGSKLPRMGWVRLHDLETLHNIIGISVERDTNFKANGPISAYAHRAYARGLIEVW